MIVKCTPKLISEADFGKLKQTSQLLFSSTTPLITVQALFQGRHDHTHSGIGRVASAAGSRPGHQCYDTSIAEVPVASARSCCTAANFGASSPPRTVFCTTTK